MYQKLAIHNVMNKIKTNIIYIIIIVVFIKLLTLSF